MVAAVLVGLNHIHQKAGEIVGVGGGTDLVGYHGEFVVGLSQIQHGLYEVLAVYAKHPGDAHGKVFGEILLDRQLTLVLRKAVDI